MILERDAPHPVSRPWWLWPNLLGLDAPVVAVVWQRFLAVSAGVPVPPAASATLFLVVWGVYLSDRRLDARTDLPGGADRHRFAARNRDAVAALALGAFLAAAVLVVFELPFVYVEAGGAVAVAVAGYLLAVHAAAGGRPGAAGAKESVVGVLFAAGVSVPLLADGSALSGWVPGAAGFAGLCGLNCLLISRWEEDAAASPPVSAAVLAAGLAVAAAVASPPDVAAALLLGVTLLAALTAARGVVPVRGRRVMADAALLAPLLVAGFP